MKLWGLSMAEKSTVGRHKCKYTQHSLYGEVAMAKAAQPCVYKRVLAGLHEEV